MIVIRKTKLSDLKSLRLFLGTIEIEFEAVDCLAQLAFSNQLIINGIFVCS